VTLDTSIARTFEPLAAPPEVRLAQAAELIAQHVAIEARIDPVLPGLSDSQNSLDGLCAALARAGVRRVAASVLFLRPAVIASLRRHIADTTMLRTLLDAFANRERLVIRAGNSRVLALPRRTRREILDRLRSAACRHGLEVRVCACKNPDISASSCNISGRWSQPAEPRQRELFDG
jgi:DNA repair photolyase